MKKQGILNAPIASLLAHLGHTDRIVVADCGLPIPREEQRIDLALSLGKPDFLEVLAVVLTDMKVEAVILAEELKASPAFLADVLAVLPEGTAVTYMPHEQFKAETHSAKGIIRTGAIIPYANIILVSGVIF